MKKLFTLSLLWVAGLFSFATLPTFAQEAEEIDADTDVAILDEATDDAIIPEEEITVEAEPSIEDAITSDPEMVSELNGIADEMLNAFDDQELTDSFNAQFETDEERALATAGLAFLFAGAWLMYLIVGLIWLIIVVIALWCIFKKAWRSGWLALIPIYNLFVLWNVAGLKKYLWTIWLWVLISICAAALKEGMEGTGGQIAEYIDKFYWLVLSVWMNVCLARKFGWKTFGQVMCAIFSQICYLILGFWSAEYNKDA